MKGLKSGLGREVGRVLGRVVQRGVGRGVGRRVGGTLVRKVVPVGGSGSDWSMWMVMG